MSEESKVRLWIWGGFMSVLVLLAIVGGVSYTSFNATLERYDDSESTSKATVDVLLAFRDLTSLRRYAAVHLDTGSESALKRTGELDAEFRKEVDEALSLTPSAERRQGIERLRGLGVSFYTRFTQAVELRARKLATLADTDAIGHKGRTALDEFSKAYHADAAIALPMETLMRARLDLARFSARSTEELNKRVAELGAAYAKEAKEMAAGQPAERQAKAAEIAALAEAFGAKFVEASAVSLEMEKLTGGVMEAIGKEISALGLKILKMQDDYQVEVSHHVKDFIFSGKVKIGILTLFAIVISIVCAVLVSRMVGRPIAEMATAARVAEEIGELIKLAAHDGDFRNRTPTEGRTGFVATISVAVNRLFDSVCEAFAGISRDASTVALAASDASGAVVEVNAGAAEQARSLEQVREAIRMSAEAITKVSGNAKSAASAAEHATGLVNRGQITIAELAGLMETIARNGREIAQVTMALGQIATKTDVLATTAAVEAARLGDQGRGFAVIGQQIGALAEHAGGFATKIGQLVETANRDLLAGLAAAGQARQVVDDIHRQVVETDGMIRLIAEAMMSQQSAIVEIDATANSLAEIGEHNVKAGEQISQRLVQLRELSDATKDAIAKFKIEKRPAA